MLAFETALYNTLKAGTALTSALGGTFIYNALAPAGSAITYPVVIFTKSSGVDDNTSPKRAKTLVYQVTGLSTKSKKEAEEIDDLCDALLQDAGFSMSVWDEYWCRRDSDISYVEEVSGKLLWHEGGLYRIRIAK